MKTAKIKLYKAKNGKLVLVDYGVFSKIQAYIDQGYTVTVDGVNPCIANADRKGENDENTRWNTNS